MTSKQRMNLRAKLFAKIEQFIEEECPEWGLGYIPENLDSSMTDAAFSVLESISELNDYFKKEDLLK